MAQNITVGGNVKDSNGEPLPGVTVLVKGTSKGTITDVNGNYSLSDVSKDATLQLSFVGMRTHEIVVGNQTRIDVRMEEETIGLQEIVAVGYGTQKKINLTGSVSNVDFESEQFSSRALVNVSTALAGTVPGLNVGQGSGLPGRDQARIRVRGIGSLNSSQEPLILIDGQVGSMDMLNPDEVSSISVLKDAASSAIYGSRASNGVILVTTKSGRNTQGKVTFNYSGRLSSGDPVQTDDFISNTVDHMVLLNQAYVNSNQSPRWTQDQINEWDEKSKTDPIGYPNTNWWDAITKTSSIMNHNLSATGGTDKIKFYTSFGHYSNDGVIPNTAYQRINFRNNLTYSVNNWFELGNIITATTSKRDPADENSIFTWWHFTTPGAVPKHDGIYGGGQTYDVELEANNGLFYVERMRGKNLTNSFTNKVFAKIKLFEGFSITGDYYLAMDNAEGWSSNEAPPWWNFQTNEATRTFSQRKSISSYYNKSQRDIYDLLVNYDVNFTVHEFKLFIGYNQEYYKYNNMIASKQDLLSFDTPVLNAAPSDPTASGGATEFATSSYFGRLNYNYSGKYLLEANFRYDGSSRFSPDNRWGFFPSLSGAWVISEEPFWNSLGDLINIFKFRASYGRLGNSGIGNYAWQSLYNPANHNFAGSVVQGLRYNEIANSNISWESTDVLNIGADLAIFQNLILELSYYNKYTNNILTRNPIPYVWGGISPPVTNAAEVSNKGFEADIRYNGNISDLFYSIGVNGSYNKNKIESYKDDYIEPHGVGAWTEGYPIGTYWIRQVDHIVQDKSEIDALVADGWTFTPTIPGEGDFLYKDANGDKRIDQNDRVLQGNPIPLINYGANLSLNYKGFDFYMLLNGIAKWDKYLHSEIYSVVRTPSRLAAKSLLNAWTPENRDTNIPKLYYGDTRNNQSSDFYLHDASFLRLKTIQLGYTIPQHVINKLNKFRIYINFENYFTFTSYPGPDPENEVRAFDSSYPIIKTMSVGLNINF